MHPVCPLNSHGSLVGSQTYWQRQQMPSAMGGPEELCKSPMVSDWQGSITSEEPTSSTHPCGSTLEGPTMVPSFTGDAVQLSTSTSPFTKPMSVGAQHGSDRLSTPTNRVAHLWQKLGCGNFKSQLRSSSLHPGEAKYLEPMTSISKSGWAGVLNRVVIPFQDPFLML